MKRIAKIKVPIKWKEKTVIINHEDKCPFRVSRYTEYNSGTSCDFCTHEKVLNDDDDSNGTYCEGIKDDMCPLEKVEE